MKLLKLIWLNGPFYVILVLFSLVAIPILSLFVTCQAPFISYRRITRLVRRAVRWYGFVVIYFLPFPFIRVRYEDRTGGRAPDPAVIVCNHRSSSDPFLMAALPQDQIAQIVNKWPLRLPIWGLGARLAEYLSINEMPVEEFFDRAGRLFRDGVTVVAFPEGTRSKGREMGPFHGTIFRMAMQIQAPIVPVCISGNERTPPRGTMVLYPALIRLRQLPALTWDDYKDLTPFQLKNKVRDMIARELNVMEGPT